MRVVAGSAGGLQLDSPKRGVRPTMNRVKAAIFSSLANKVIGARVLDLFAGSGALGIEALSRGAAAAVFVEQDRQSVAVIETNLARTNLKARVHQQDVFKFLRLSRAAESFDLIFADPPYDKAKSGASFTNELLLNEDLPGLLAPEGVFVLEKVPTEALPQTSHWRVIRRRTYGATEVLFLSAVRLPLSETN